MNELLILYLSGFFSSYFYYNVLKENIINDPDIDIILFFYIFSIYFSLRFILFIFNSFHFNK